MPNHREPGSNSIWGLLSRFRLECAKEIECLERYKKKPEGASGGSPTESAGEQDVPKEY